MWRDLPSRSVRRLVALGLLAFALLAALEVGTDGLHWPDVLADLLQIAILVGTAVFAALLATQMRSQHEEQMNLIRGLAQARTEGAAWRREAESYLAGLSSAIQRQFDDWGMTAAEREVGLLMLKGLSHKEIASLRGTSDATVRHQAKAVYQKAGVESRTAFCAFFLEDLLPGASPGAEEAGGPTLRIAAQPNSEPSAAVDAGSSASRRASQSPMHARITPVR